MADQTTMKLREYRMFWENAKKLRTLRREGLRCPARDHAADELEVLREYTESPLLKPRIDDALAAKEAPCGLSA